MIERSITPKELFLKMGRRFDGDHFLNRKWFIETTTRCSGRCPGCMRQMIPKGFLQRFNKSDLDPKYLYRIPKRDTLNICGISGEPTCWKPLIEVIDKKKWAHVLIHTNGVCHGKDYWYRLAEVLSYNEDNTVVFAMDGLDKDTYKMYRKLLKWERLHKNLKHFIAAGGNATLQFILFKHNEHQKSDVKKFAQDIGCNAILFKGSFECRDKKRRLFTGNDGYFCLPKEQRIVYMNSEGLIFPCCHMMGHYMVYQNTDKLEYKKFYRDIRNSVKSQAFNMDILKERLCRKSCAYDRRGDYYFIDLRKKKGYKDETCSETCSQTV
jgi:MoaA/NifB/PqqE/SkfB family radical SAM enzyme